MNESNELDVCLESMSSNVTERLTELRIAARELHEKTLIELQNSAAIKIDNELKERIGAFTKQLDMKKEKASLFVLQQFNEKTRELCCETKSDIINCLKFDTDGQVEAHEERVLINNSKLTEMSALYLDQVNQFYCHKIDTFVCDPKSSMNCNLESDEHIKGQLFWSDKLVCAAQEWEQQNSHKTLLDIANQKAAVHERNILTYVVDQLRVAFTLMCSTLKSDLLNLLASMRVESLRIRDKAMHDFHAITKNIKNNIRKIDRCISSDVTTLRTSSYVLNQAQEQEKLFAKTLSKAVDMCTKNVVVAAKLSIMREIDRREHSGVLRDLLLKLLDEIQLFS